MANWAALQEATHDMPVFKRAKHGILLHAFPCKTNEHVGNRTLIYAKHKSESLLRILSSLIKLSHLPNFIWGKYVLMPNLRNHIRNIVIVCTKKKMVGIHAPSIIAMMAHLKPIWNITIYKRPRIAVGENSFTINAYPTITSIPIIPSPNPATAFVRCLVNIVPKSINWTSNLRSSGTSPIAIMRQTFYRARTESLKFFSTILTDACDGWSYSFHSFLHNRILTLTANYSIKRCLWQIG